MSLQEVETCLYKACLRGDRFMARDAAAEISILLTNDQIPGHYQIQPHRNWDSTPLHEACRHGWLDIVQFFVEKLNHSLDVTEKSKLQSPLHISCQYGQFDIMIYLTERGCTRTLRDIEGKEPLDYALNDKIMNYLCNHLKTSTSEATYRIIIYYMLRITFQKNVSCHFDWKTYSGVNNTVKIMRDYCNTLIPVPTQRGYGIINVYTLVRINDHRDLIPLATCHTKSCVSSAPSKVIREYLGDNSLDPMKLVVSDSCNWKTADGDTLLQLVCQSQSYVSRISSTVMLKWLTNTECNLLQIILPRSKTADGDTLLQLVCQSQSCLSRLPSRELKIWLKNTTVDLLLSGLDWSTADDVTVIDIVRQLGSQPIEQVIIDNSIDVVIIPHWEMINGRPSLQVLYRSELYTTKVPSSNMFKWLQCTSIDVKRIVVPHWKTADGDTLLQLVCQSESCVSNISSKVLRKWLTDTYTILDFKKLINLKYKTADGDTLLQLVCLSKPCVSRISSEVMLKWLTGPAYYDQSTIFPSNRTADGYTLLQLIIQSESCVSRINSSIMEVWLKNTDVELRIPLFGLDWKTADGVTVIDIVHQLVGYLTQPLEKVFRGDPIDVVITPHSKTFDNGKSLQVSYSLRSEKYISHNIPSKIMLQWLENTSLDIEEILLNVSHWKTADGETLLQLIWQSKSCVSRISSTVMQKWMNDTTHDFKQLIPLYKTKNGDTLLELVCHSEYLLSRITSQIVLNWLNNSNAYLLKVDILPSLKKEERDTMFKLICGSQILLSHTSSSFIIQWINNGSEAILEILKSVNPNSTTAEGYTILHLLCQSSINETRVVELLECYLKKDINPTVTDRGGNMAIHFACIANKPAVVKHLLKHGKCNPSCKNSSNELPIELTENIDTISHLVDHGATITPELILKFATEESIPNEQLAQLIGNPDASDSEGNTALHLACQADQPDTVNLLLSQTHCNPNIKNNKKEVPLQITTNSDIIKDLIRYGAQTSIMYESLKSALGTNQPIKPPVKIFVVGNPYVGKSTLTEALKKKLNFVVWMFTSGKVSGVDKKTVGIIPHKIDSEIFGRVTVYDFAGHKEFYSGHAALLKASILSNPPIFIVVVNLCHKVNTLLNNILYWIYFLENQCTFVSCKPHLIIIGSHADTLMSKGLDPQEKVNDILKLLCPNYFINLEFKAFIPMDCQLHESTGMENLRPLLKNSCRKLRIQEPIAFNAHCFLVYLLETFKQTPAVTLSTVHEQIEKSHKEGVLDFLPKSIGALYKICIELNERGHILFLQDKINVESSYVVIEEKSLLSEVSGTLFASEDFKQYKQLATNTGVVSLTKIAECFPGKDLKILIGLLTHLEFCYEISTADQTLFQVISDNYSPDFDEQYYLFSGLISSEPEKSVWKTKSDFDYSFGWILRCTELEQFFSSRFLQVLLLRLAFSLAFEFRSSSQGDDPSINLGIHRKCSLWKNGIFWGTHFGMDTLVEVIDNKSVVVMARFKASHVVKCVAHRSQIIHTVLECAKEFCPRISTVESFIETSSSPLEYPFELTSETYLCTIKDLSEALVKYCEDPSVVLSESAKSFSAVSFFSFEPYAEIQATILKELWDKVNENEVVPDIFISRLIKKVSIQNLQFMIKVFNKEADIPSRSTKDDLYQEILNWRDTSDTEPKTYSQLRKEFDQHSVFAGRNLLVSTVYI